MRPSPIPDNEMWPGATRVIVRGPDADPRVAPVEAVHDIGPDTGMPRLSVRLEIEPWELDQLAAGGTVWLSFYGGMPVFSVDIKAPGE